MTNSFYMHPKYQGFLGSIKNLESDARVTPNSLNLAFDVWLSQQEKKPDTYDDVILWHGAFNYYCGRSTMAVDSFIDDLVKNWPNLSEKTQFLIKRDLERDFIQDDEDRRIKSRHNRLGHDCDRKNWEKVRALWGAK